MLGLDDCTVAALAYLTYQHVVITDWILSFQIVLRCYIILRLMLLLGCFVWGQLVGLINTTRHRIHHLSLRAGCTKNPKIIFLKLPNILFLIL